MLWIVLLVCWLAPALAQTADQAQTAAADSVRKYRFLAKTAREKNELDAALQYYREYLKYSPADPKALFWVGKILYDKQDFSGARQALSQAVTLDSLYLNSNLMLYQLFLQTSEPDSAALYLERTLRLKPDEPKRPQYCRSLADAYYRQGNARQALRYYLQVAQSSPPDGSLIELIAVLYEGTGDPAQALAWRQKLLAAGTAGGGVSADQRRSLKSMAELQIKTGDTKGAYATLMQLVQLDSLNRREALEAVSELQIKTGDTRGAYATLMQLIQLDSLNRYSYYSRIAQLGERFKDPAMQVKGLEGMVQANPKDLGALIALAEWYLNAGNDRSAERVVQRGLRLDPGNARLLLLSGDCLARQGPATEAQAIAAFEKAKADPAWTDIAQQRIYQLRPPETEEQQSKRELLYDHFSRLAQAAEKSGDNDMLLTGLEGMAQNHPRDIEPLARLADWYLKASDPGTAEQWVERGLQIYPSNARLQVLRGDCLARQGAAKEAIAAFEKAKVDTAWSAIAQQRIKQLRTSGTQEEKR